MDRYEYDRRQEQLVTYDQRREAEERFLPPTDDQIKRTLAARAAKEAKDGSKQS